MRHDYIPLARLFEVRRVTASVFTSVLFEAFLASGDVLAVFAETVLAEACNTAFVVVTKWINCSISFLKLRLVSEGANEYKGNMEELHLSCCLVQAQSERMKSSQTQAWLLPNVMMLPSLSEMMDGSESVSMQMGQSATQQVE